jgi:hypothetical protein
MDCHLTDSLLKATVHSYISGIDRAATFPFPAGTGTLKDGVWLCLYSARERHKLKHDPAGVFHHVGRDKC